MSYTDGRCCNGSETLIGVGTFIIVNRNINQIGLLLIKVASVQLYIISIKKMAIESFPISKLKDNLSLLYLYVVIISAINDSNPIIPKLR